MKVITDREKRVLHFDEQPEVAVRLDEFQTIWGTCAAWERLRIEGVDDDVILALIARAKFTEQVLSYEARQHVFKAIAEQINHLGVEAVWATIDTICREAHQPSPAAAKIVGQFEASGLTATEIGDRFVSRFRTA